MTPSYNSEMPSVSQVHAKIFAFPYSTIAPQVEDIIDTGATLKRVVARLQEAGAASVKVPISS
jgi:hypoxanthine-guanine phosphoribosyltransferase